MWVGKQHSRHVCILAGVSATVSQTPTALLSFRNVDVTISGSSFSRLDGGRGGSVVSYSGGSLTVEDTTFSGCSAAGNDSAVLLVDGATLAVTGSRFLNNYSEFAGGAILATDSSIRISGSRWACCSESKLQTYYELCLEQSIVRSNVFRSSLKCSSTLPTRPSVHRRLSGFLLWVRHINAAPQLLRRGRSLAAQRAIVFQATSASIIALLGHAHGHV